jgi:hypothetical protein
VPAPAGGRTHRPYRTPRTAEGEKLLSGRRGGRRVDVADHHGVTIAREASRRGTPDAGSGACDESDFTTVVSHGGQSSATGLAPPCFGIGRVLGVPPTDARVPEPPREGLSGTHV